jgi:membrane-bound lytic murein transglycosylase B
VNRPLLSSLAAGALIVLSAAAPALAQPARFDLSRPEIRAFVKEVAKRDHIPRKRLLRFLARAEPQPKIIELMERPAEHVLQWWEYRNIFITERRITEGVQFWLDHRETLERVAQERGIPPEYLVGILGCETFYGRITGGYRVLDALATLAFDYPPRGEFFRGELEQFILLTREEHIDPSAAKGSYSGAMGAPQFMPSAYRRYAVDASHDHKRDLWNNWADVLASVANYFIENGWHPGEPVLAPARLDPDPDFQLDPRTLELTSTVEKLSERGVHVDIAVAGSTPAMLIAATEQDGPQYRVGFHNFRVITRYNRSALYAMAVSDLAASVAAHVHSTPAAAPAAGPTAGAGP